MKTSYFFKKTCMFAALGILSSHLYAQTVVSGVAYNVISDQEAAEVVALPSGDKYTGTITIQANVEIGGTTYPVKKIGDGSLRDAPALTGVIIPDGLEIVGNSSFANCSGITEIVLPASVSSIEDWAFYGCSNLSTINIPDGVTTIGEHTFQLSGVTSIQLPASVTELKVCAFQDANKLASINLENVKKIGQWALYKTALTTVSISNVFTIGGEAFRQCPNLTTVVLKDVITVGGWAFEGCEKLISVNLGNTLETIDKGAFSGCRSLTSITIPRTATLLDSWSFEKTGLTEIFASWEDPAGEVFIGIGEGEKDEPTFGKGDDKPSFTWKVPESVIDAWGYQYLGFPVEIGEPTSIGNSEIQVNVSYENGSLHLIGMDGAIVSVMTLDGRTIATINVSGSDVEIPLSLSTGIYLLKVIDGNKQVAVKFAVK